MKRVLIVDDDHTFQFVLKKLLMEYVECDSANDGMEAIKLFNRSMREHRPYDLICLDILMPNLSGLDTRKIIRRIEKDLGVDHLDQVKIMFISIINEDMALINDLHYGYESFLQKPIDQHGLSQILTFLELDISIDLKDLS